MGKLKRTVSTVMAVMIALNVFAGLAAATPDVYAEPPDISNDKPGYSITCPNYGISLVYQADTYPSNDADWFTCSVNAGDKIGQFIEDAAFNNGTAGYAYDANNKLVEYWSKYGSSGDNIVSASPIYSKIVNEVPKVYYGYQIFLARNWP